MKISDLEKEIPQKMTQEAPLNEQILHAWARGAKITYPDRDERALWITHVWALADSVRKGKLTVQDIQDYTEYLCSDPYRRQSPQLWSMKFIRNTIYQWLQTGERKRKKLPPPPGWKSGMDHLGRIRSWNYQTGEEWITDPFRQPEITVSQTHGTVYQQKDDRQVLVKRPNRIGYQLDFFLDGYAPDLGEQEIRQLQEIAHGRSASV